MKAVEALKVFDQKVLARLWKCSQPTVSYKLKHSSVSVVEYSMVIKKYPEYAEILLAALR